MADRDWEAEAALRLRRHAEDTVTRLRAVADQIQRETKRALEDAAKPERDYEWHTYSRVASQALDAMNALTFNVRISHMIEAAATADVAREASRKGRPVVPEDCR
jgi:hypothetical protein